VWSRFQPCRKMVFRVARSARPDRPVAARIVRKAEHRIGPNPHATGTAPCSKRLRGIGCGGLATTNVTPWRLI
jgi:hypothetical protein